MKHVFVINSHTTYLTTMGTINYLKLDVSSIIFLLVRNYKNEYLCKDFRIIETSLLSYESEKAFASKNIWRKNKTDIIKKIDEFIITNIGQSYCLYAPHLAHPLWVVLYTNKACCHFSYIQEGLAPFAKRFVMSPPLLGYLEILYYDMLVHGRMWYYRPWYLKTRIRTDIQMDAYANNEKFFKYLPLKTTIVQWPLPKQDISVNFEEDHKIFIYDAYVVHHVMKSDDYIMMCKKLIETQAANINYLKFHPGQSKEEIDAIKDFFKSKNLKFQVLDNAIPFEYIIMTKKNLKLTGYGSTLLYLAHDYGHKVNCYDEELLKFKSYRRYKKINGGLSFNEYVNL